MSLEAKIDSLITEVQNLRKDMRELLKIAIVLIAAMSGLDVATNLL